MADLNDFNPNTVWRVDGKDYMSKVDAMVASCANNNSKIEFYYYDTEFNEFNWLKEPIEPFFELARQRAQQLRDSNRYLRLWYSGGADSHTVLQVFMQNNIYLDEIVMVRTDPLDNFESIGNREENGRSLPYINSVRLELPNTKISIIDIGADAYLEYYKTDDWFLHVVANYCFADDPGIILSSRRNIEKYAGLKMHPGGVEITGNTKAKVIRHNDVYYIPKTDTSFHYLHWANVRDFFTCPEFLKLHSKQCHELKHLVEKWYPHGNVDSSIYDQATMNPLFQKEWYDSCRSPRINPEVDFGKSSGNMFNVKSLPRMADAAKNNPELLKAFMGPLKDLQKELEYHWPVFDKSMNNVLTTFLTLGPYDYNNRK